MYALILDADDRIIDIVPPDEAPESCPRIAKSTLPKGFLDNYKYVEGEFVYDPLPEPEEPKSEPTADEILNALLGVE